MYPVDIEEVIITRHPAVKDVAVFGIPHQQWGETPVAAIVMKEDCGLLPGENVRSWANERIAARFQKVHDVIVVPELPRNIAGKILKRELKEHYFLCRRTNPRS